jgi:serine/threonine-protein kinase RsbW
VDVKFCLVFPREAVSVPVMRHMLGDALLGLGADDKGVSDLLLAVTEACTNVVRHGGPSHRYEVVASVGRCGCRIEVQDSGRGFDPGHVPGTWLRRPAWSGSPPVARGRRRSGRPATLRRAHRRARTARAEAPAAGEGIAALPESGRGLAIMRACVDDVTLRSGPEQGTVVSLQKRIAWRDGAPLPADSAGQLADAG